MLEPHTVGLWITPKSGFTMLQGDISLKRRISWLLTSFKQGLTDLLFKGWAAVINTSNNNFIRTAFLHVRQQGCVRDLLPSFWHSLPAENGRHSHRSLRTNAAFAFLPFKLRSKAGFPVTDKTLTDGDILQKSTCFRRHWLNTQQVYRNYSALCQNTNIGHLNATRNTTGSGHEDHEIIKDNVGTGRRKYGGSPQEERG